MSNLDQSLYYLAYGSNLHPLRLEARLGKVNRIGNVMLPGWNLCFHKRGADGSGKGNLIQRQKSCAWGVIFEVSTQQKQRLDEFEGDGYEVQSLEVNVDGVNYNSFCYIAEPEWIDDSLIPHDWYQLLILLGAQHAVFPTRYLSQIQAQKTQYEPQGNTRHQQMLTAMRDSI